MIQSTIAARPGMLAAMGWSVAVLLLVASGCVAHQSVGRPPSRAEIERINSYGQAHGDLRIEYVSPAPVCAAGLCGLEHLGGGQPEEIAGIVSSTVRDTVVLTEDGRNWTLRTETIAAAHARNRARGAVVGALVGAALGMALTAGIYAVAESGSFRESDPSAPASSPTTAGDVFKWGLLLTTTQAAGGAAWGFLLGGRQSFDFDVPAR